MNHYLEITLIDGEKSLYELWSALYSQVHISLAEMQKKNIYGIGMSFPNYRFLQKNGKTFASLGDKLRIFASSKEILSIFEMDLKHRLDKYVKNWDDVLHFKSIKAVPENHRHAIFKRYHASPSKEAIARRFAHRHSVDYQTSLQRLENYQPELIAYPFIELKSETTGQNFRLYIVQEFSEQAHTGEFNSYGLNSANTVITVPHW